MSIARGLVLAALLILAQDGSAPAVLRAGATLEGEITDADAKVFSETLDTHYNKDGAPVGRSVVLEVERGGTYSLELRSWFFDAYLVLRDADGAVLAEDDDGLVGTHARVVAELEPGAAYRVDACALHGERGPFELALRDGTEVRADLELDDAERRVRAMERAHGPAHADVARALRDLSELLEDRGDYAGAQLPAERALAIREEVLGPEDPATAQSLNDLAQLHVYQGRYALARPLYERALAIKTETLGPSHVSVATTLSDLGVLLSRQGDYAGARSFYERALAIYEAARGPDDPGNCTTLENLALVRKNLGDFAGAQELVERALAIREASLGPSHPDVATSLHNLASLLAAQGDQAGARERYERALAIREEVLGPEHPSTVTTENNLGLLLLEAGDYAGARPRFEHALAVWERHLGPEHPTTLRGLANLGLALGRQGDLDGARRIYERLLAARERVLGPDHPDTARTLNSLARVLVAQGDLAGARPLYERALDVLERTLGPEHSAVAMVLHNLSRLHRLAGDADAGIELGRHALAICEQVLGPDHPRTATSLMNLATALYEQGDCEGARPLMERAVAICEKALGPGHPRTSSNASTLAQLELASGDARAAWDTIARRAGAERAQLQATLQSLSEAESYGFVSGLRWQLDVQLSIGSAMEDPAVTAASYRRLLEWKGRIARVLAAGRDRLAREMDDEQRELVDGLHRAQTSLSKALSENRPQEPDERARFESRIEALQDERNALELELLRSLEASDPEPVPTLGELAAALPAGSAVVDFFVHDFYEPAGDACAGSWNADHACAWILRAGEPAVVRVDLGSRSALQEAVRDHRARLALESVARGTPIADAGTDEAAEEARGASLADLLWAPLARHLDGVDLVFVSPDSFLGTLPLETIQREDGTFLIENVAFVYQQDVASLARPRAQSPGPMDSLLAVGAVDFGGRSEWDAPETPADGVRSNAALRGTFGDAWSALPATDREARAVRSLHEETHESRRDLLLQGGDATEERLKHELPRHAVLHLATHGFFRPEGAPSPWDAEPGEPDEGGESDELAHLTGRLPGLLSGLVCAGVNLAPDGDLDDGYLTAEEVGWLDLSRVELVVMSACETGLGRAESGEGLIGLRRAFRTAGARTVISSLWSVGDESTAELMRDFYANLWTGGMGRLEALRSAQLAMLERNREEHGAALPATWGAFVLSGDWR